MFLYSLGKNERREKKKKHNALKKKSGFYCWETRNAIISQDSTELTVTCPKDRCTHSSAKNGLLQAGCYVYTSHGESDRSVNCIFTVQYGGLTTGLLFIPHRLYISQSKKEGEGKRLLYQDTKNKQRNYLPNTLGQNILLVATF